MTYHIIKSHEKAELRKISLSKRYIFEKTIEGGQINPTPNIFRVKVQKKNTESLSPRVSKTSNGKTMLSSKCGICGSKKSRFIKEQ